MGWKDKIKIAVFGYRATSISLCGKRHVTFAI